MDVNKMSIKDFLKLPERKWDEVVICDSIIILPAQRKSDLHDSGYRNMDFVAVVNNDPICRLSGYSDVIHLDGIGGYGYRWFEKYHTVPKTVERSAWSMDCLPKSGLLRLWGRGKIYCDSALSSFEVYILHKEDKPKQEAK